MGSPSFLCSLRGGGIPAAGRQGSQDSLALRREETNNTKGHRYCSAGAKQHEAKIRPFLLVHLSSTAARNSHIESAEAT